MADTSPASVCIGKDKHPTKAAAAAAATDARARHGGRWTGYRCPFCDGFHIGHVARVLSKNDRARRGGAFAR